MSELARRDRGMTLPEVLIAVVILGMIMVVLTAVVQFAIVGQGASAGRIQVARDEQALALVLPNDLASASDVSVDPGASPCAGTCAPGPTALGSNALLLTWTTGAAGGPSATWVRVSYQFVGPDSSGAYQLRRVACSSADQSTWTCRERTVLDNLTGPPGGQSFVPGVTVPNWVLQVSAPLSAGAVDDTQLASAHEIKDARRVVVTINGGGSSAGAGGGTNQISITAGGTLRSDLAPSDVFHAPTFSTARSRCGGPVALIVDDSGSIGSAMSTVRQGVQTFVETFAGTPTDLQVVRFDSTAGVLGAGSSWSRYFDLSDPTEVSSLIGSLGAMTADGGTNWEDAWFRAFYQPDGTLLDPIPELVVFFTDGKQTFERLRLRAAPGQIIPDAPPLPGPGWPTTSAGYYSNGYEFTQVGFNRTDWIVDQFRSSTRMIGVGVGGITTKSSMWSDNPGAGYHLEYERGYRMYQKLSGSNWVYITSTEYDAGNTTDDESDGFRVGPKQYVTADADALDWEPTTETRTDGGYRSVQVFAEPYTDYTTPDRVSVSDKVILSRLIAGNDHAVEANWNSSEQRYDNAETAELYSLDNVDKFAQALRAVALAECGGTLSVTTRLNGGGKVPIEVAIQNTKVANSAGTPLAVEPTVVKVNSTFPVGTFDFAIPSAGAVLVDVMPVDSVALGSYQPDPDVPWTCRVGLEPRTYTPIAVADSNWVGARVQVGANEAVSCTLEVVSG